MLTSEFVVLVSIYFNAVIVMNTSLIFLVYVTDGNNNNNNNNIIKYAGITAQGDLQNKHEYTGAQIYS